MRLQKTAFKAFIGVVFFSAMLCLALAFGSCADKYKTAWYSIKAVQTAAETTDKGIAVANRYARKKCQDSSKDDAVVKKCILESREYRALKTWRDVAVPTINSSLMLSIAGLSLAEKIKSENFNVVNDLRFAACAIITTARAFGDLYPANVQNAVLGYLEIIGKVACDDIK